MGPGVRQISAVVLGGALSALSAEVALPAQPQQADPPAAGARTAPGTPGAVPAVKANWASNEVSEEIGALKVAVRLLDNFYQKNPSLRPQGWGEEQARYVAYVGLAEKTLAAGPQPRELAAFGEGLRGLGQSLVARLEILTSGGIAAKTPAVPGLGGNLGSGAPPVQEIPFWNVGDSDYLRLRNGAEFTHTVLSQFFARGGQPLNQAQQTTLDNLQLIAQSTGPLDMNQKLGPIRQRAADLVVSMQDNPQAPVDALKNFMTQLQGAAPAAGGRTAPAQQAPQLSWEASWDRIVKKDPYIRLNPDGVRGLEWNSFRELVGGPAGFMQVRTDAQMLHDFITGLPQAGNASNKALLAPLSEILSAKNGDEITDRHFRQLQYASQLYHQMNPGK